MDKGCPEAEHYEHEFKDPDVPESRVRALGLEVRGYKVSGFRV